MNFFKTFILLIFLFSTTILFADSHDQNQTNNENELNEIQQALQDEEEVPLNDPFAGNEGLNSLSNVPQEEQDEPMSIYNFNNWPKIGKNKINWFTIDWSNFWKRG